MEIKASAGELEAASGVITSSKSEIDGIIADVDSWVRTNLLPSWDQAGKDEYEAQHRKWMQASDSISQAMTQFSQAVMTWSGNSGEADAYGRSLFV